MFALNAQPSRLGARKGFSLVELIAVMVVLAILAGVAAPRFFSYSSDAKSAALQGTLGGVRTGIANFYANAAITGTPAYPTFEELTAVGTVMQEAIPENPYTGLKTVKLVKNLGNATDRAVAQPTKFGWNYYVDNKAVPPVAYFWANCEDETRIVETAKNNGKSTYFTANDI